MDAALRRGRVASLQIHDPGDQGGVRGALPGVALEQAPRWVQQEPQQRTLGFGQVERLLQGTPGGGWVAQRVPRDRLEKNASTSQDRQPTGADSASTGASATVAACGSS